MSLGASSVSPVYIAGPREPILRAASYDMVGGLCSYRLWMFLGWQDIRQRYRRSVLGPLWLTLSTCIMIIMMSILYGSLFRLPLDVYVPFLASGTVLWGLIASLMNESCSAFMAADSLIKQVNMPLSLHVYRMVWRNLIVFFHNVLILVPVWFVFGRQIGLLEVLSVLLALVVIAVNGLWVGVLLGALCARFRDVSQIITNLTQVVFFVTPIMWLPSILDGRGVAWWVVVLNPFFHFMEIARAPFLGNPVPFTSWGVVSIITLGGTLFGMVILGRFRKRVVYWL